MDTISKGEDEATVASLQEGLKQANDRGQAKLAGLLKAVRDDITFELKLIEAPSVSRRREEVPRAIERGSGLRSI